MPNNPAKYEVLIKQCLRSILDISEEEGHSTKTNICFVNANKNFALRLSNHQRFGL